MADDKNDGTVNLEKENNWYKDLLNDPDFEKLEIELQKPNIFSILGISRKELKHSNILVWLLDPNGSHGLGSKFLIRVLRDLATHEKNDSLLNIIDINKLNFSNVEIKREVSYSNDKGEKGSIDMLIDFRDEDDKLVICIENKIDTEDSKGQLDKYQEFINKDEKFFEYKRKVFVYLTPYGKEPVNFKGEKEWYNYSYEKEIIKHLENIQNATTNLTIQTYISDYLSTLKKEIMSTNDSARDLANAIYKEHKDIIDFISNYRDANVKYQQYWEKEHPKVNEFAKKFIELIRNADPENEYELGYIQNNITIKRKLKTQNRYFIIYYVFNGAKPNSNIDFSFPDGEDKDKTKKNVIDIVDKNNKVEYSDKTYFRILSANNLSSDELIEMHKKRFGIADKSKN